jgi:hypothetical protein
MKSLGAQYGGWFELDAGGSGCNAGATWCVHATLITTRPHAPSNASTHADYSDFAGRPVCRAYIEQKGAEAGLSP